MWLSVLRVSASVCMATGRAPMLRAVQVCRWCGWISLMVYDEGRAKRQSWGDEDETVG